MNDNDTAPLMFTTVTLRRGGRSVVEDFNLTVSPGVSLLLGDNGAGKSTLIAALLDLIPRAEGEIHVYGMRSDASSARSRLFYLPERFEPPWYLTGYEFLAYTLGLRGDRLDRAAAEALALRLTLNPVVLGRRARHFSKGMTQKLGLMAAFLSSASLLVLDEPTSGLDPTARAAFLTEVEAATRAGRDFFITSHALADARRLAGSVGAQLAILRRGCLVAQGSLAELLAQHECADLEVLYARV